MGYDITGWKTKYKESVAGISCNYAWQPNFKKSLGFDISELNGRVTKSNRYLFIEHLNKLIDGVINEVETKNYRGSVCNCSNEDLIDGLTQIINGIERGDVRYLTVG